MCRYFLTFLNSAPSSSGLAGAAGESASSASPPGCARAEATMRAQRVEASARPTRARSAAATKAASWPGSGPQARVHAVEREREGCVGEQRLQLADGLLRRSGNRLRRDGGEIRVHFVRAVVFQRDRDRRDGEAG